MVQYFSYSPKNNPDIKVYTIIYANCHSEKLTMHLIPWRIGVRFEQGEQPWKCFFQAVIKDGNSLNLETWLPRAIVNVGLYHLFYSLSPEKLMLIAFQEEVKTHIVDLTRWNKNKILWFIAESRNIRDIAFLSIWIVYTAKGDGGIAVVIGWDFQLERTLTVKRGCGRGRSEQGMNGLSQGDDLFRWICGTRKAWMKGMEDNGGRMEEGIFEWNGRNGPAHNHDGMDGMDQKDRMDCGIISNPEQDQITEEPTRDMWTCQ